MGTYSSSLRIMYHLASIVTIASCYLWSPMAAFWHRDYLSCVSFAEARSAVEGH